MGPVSGTKGIVHIKISEAGQLFSKGRIIIGFFFVVAKIFQQQHIAFLKFADCAFNCCSKAIIDKGNIFAQQFA